MVKFTSIHAIHAIRAAFRATIRANKLSFLSVMPKCEVVCHSGKYVEDFLAQATQDHPDKFNQELTEDSFVPYK